MSIFIGVWSNGKTQMKHFVRTTHIGLKRKLKKNFKVYNLSKYKTSKNVLLNKRRNKKFKNKRKKQK